MIQDSNAHDREDARGGGRLLREAREAAGLTIQEAAARVRMPVHVVEALERGDWAGIGAPVFVRGQLRSYARLLKVDLEPMLRTEVAPVVPVDLVSHTHTPRYQRVIESIGRRAVYVVITAAIAVPVWFTTRSHFAEAPPSMASLDALPETTGSAVTPASLPAPPPVVPASQPQDQAPYVASLAPQATRSPPPVAAAAAGLELVFQGDSWMQASGADGQTVEQGLMRAGDSRTFQAGDVARVVLGNASAVRVQQAGSIVDLTPYQRANVARFAVSSDGSVAPAE